MKRKPARPTKTPAISRGGKSRGTAETISPRPRTRSKTLATGETISAAFDEVLQLIEAARHKAFQAVNVALIELYWNVGQIISRKIAAAEWGDGVVDELAAFLARTQPGLKGFSRQNLFRMKQFYEAYRDHSIVSALLRQLPWTHHLIILGQSKMPEEREFYLRLAAREKWSSRELERQFRTALFERTVHTPPKVSAALSEIHPDAVSDFKDSYVLEFLGFPMITRNPTSTADSCANSGNSSPNSAATSASSGPRCRSRWASATSRSTCFSSIAV